MYPCNDARRCGFAAASSALLPDDNAVKSLIRGLYDPLYVVGAGGLGASLFLIHIYVTPIKRTLQALWVAGVLGSLGIAVNFAAPANQGLVEFALNNSAAIWAVGPLFASLTGLVFKEGKLSISYVTIFWSNSLLASGEVESNAHVSVARPSLNRKLCGDSILQGCVMASLRQLLCSLSYRHCCWVAL